MWTLQVRRRVAGSSDAHGNPTATYATATDWLVRGFAPGASREGDEVNRDMAEIAWTVYAEPDATAPGYRDRVILSGVEYEVASPPADWTKGPWPHPTAGLVVELSRVEG